MNKLIATFVILSFSTFAFTQSIERVKIGGYIYPTNKVYVPNALTYCSDGTLVTVLGKVDEKFIKVRYHNIEGFMYYSAIENSGNIPRVRKVDLIALNNRYNNDEIISNEDVIKIKLTKVYGGT